MYHSFQVIFLEIPTNNIRAVKHGGVIGSNMLKTVVAQSTLPEPNHVQQESNQQPITE